MKVTKYSAKQIDSRGYIRWDEHEHAIWRDLYDRQIDNIKDKACQPYLAGLEQLGLSNCGIPQLPDIDAILHRATGWETAAVPCLINFDKFFTLLAQKRFPVATFIRNRDEFDYLQEPDIFHEIFGHCPLLTNPAFAHFTHTYGKLGLNASKEERIYLARMYWFSVEFGLVKEDGDFKIYGGGILSSPQETEYALHSSQPQRQPFAIEKVLRTPYRIDILQPIYFVLSQIDDLFDIAQSDLMTLIRHAQKQGLLPPLFEQPA